MIPPTMTPEEKVRQMEKMKPLLYEAAMGWLKHNGSASIWVVIYCFII